MRNEPHPSQFLSLRESATRVKPPELGVMDQRRLISSGAEAPLIFEALTVRAEARTLQTAHPGLCRSPAASVAARPRGQIGTFCPGFSRNSIAVGIDSQRNRRYSQGQIKDLVALAIPRIHKAPPSECSFQSCAPRFLLSSSASPRPPRRLRRHVCASACLAGSPCASLLYPILLPVRSRFRRSVHLQPSKGGTAIS